MGKRAQVAAGGPLRILLQLSRGREDGDWVEDGKVEGERRRRLERDEGGGSGGSGEVQGHLAGFQPGCLDAWSVHREGGRLRRADQEFHWPDDTRLPSLVLPNPPTSQMEKMRPEEVR